MDKIDVGESKIRDISLHEFGRKEMDIAEVEMPGIIFILYN
jgi:S-adenosylhomocysteine hydrolase